MTSKIELENVTYIYGKDTPFEVRALDSVNLSIYAGMITGIIGHTGSGKSTLVRLFNGLEKPESGRVLLDGTDIWEKPREIGKVRFRVGLVMQYPEYQLFEETVAADIAFGPRNMGMTPEETEAAVEEAARFTGLDRSLLDKSPFDLSGGQKRRAALAGVIAMHPGVLVLDEPAAGLDPGGRREILGRIREFCDSSGTTVIIVSHSMEDMAMYCDCVTVMSDGHIAFSGTPAQVFSRSEELFSLGLDVPQITRVAAALERRGIDIGRDIYTVKFAFERICEYIDGLNGGSKDEY